MTSSPKAVRIGLAIDLSATASAHTQTFLQATQAWAATSPHTLLTLVSDDRTTEGGARAARTLMHQGVHAVVGHFSSHAARAALPIYRLAGIPVLLPAATNSVLYQPGCPQVGLLSASDDQLMAALLTFTAPWRHAQKVSWHVEPPRALPDSEDFDSDDATGVPPIHTSLHVVLGSEAYARQALEHSAELPEDWVLVDDAGSPVLVNAARPPRTIRAFGNRSRWTVPPPRPEPMFYWETWCALEIAAQLAQSHEARVAGRHFHTTCGVISFNECGVASTAAHAVWEAPSLSGQRL